MKMKNEEMMMRRTYLSFIHYILFISVVLLTGCAGEDKLATGSDTLSGDGTKTPLRIEATLSTGSGITRAADKTFVEGDQLKVYLRHTTGNTKGSYTSVTADQAPRLVTLTKASSAAMTTTADANIDATDDLSASYTSTGSTIVNKLYWDDFSNSAAASTDLRTSGHGLQSYYGYCYNGGTPSTTLTETTGALGWTVKTDQQTHGSKTSDLLWSNEQETIIYGHDDKRENGTLGHGTLTIPFTHAMSEITVTLTAAEGFSGNPLTNTVLTLNSINTVTSLTAPTATVNSSGTSDNITMFAEDYTGGGLIRNFTAIIAPGTKLKQGEKLLDIKGVDDNDYTLTITGNMMEANLENGWRYNHTAEQIGEEDGMKYVITQPGVNYHLNVTVKKTVIQTHATLADWKTVTASGEGAIKFDNDANDPVLMNDEYITGVEGMSVVIVDKNKFTSGASFSLFTLPSTVSNGEATAHTNNEYTFATKTTFVDNAGDANDEWTNNPQIYWPNKSTYYYFRALAQYNSTTGEVNNIQSVGTDNANPPTLNKETAVAVSQGTIAGGHDILWGTTAKHKGTSTGTTYNRGQAIPPRTGDVPIAFEHAMSKITIRLETTNDATVTNNNAKVELSGATISISNLYTSGTITIENGEIERAATKTVAAITAMSAPISEFIVIPQPIGNEAKLTITLADGTTYSLQLNTCVETGGTTPISTWERGKHYTYTIHLEKEQITFRALVKDWDDVTGSGNANLEWD